MVEKIGVAGALAIASLIWMHQPTSFSAIAPMHSAQVSDPIAPTNGVDMQQLCPQGCHTWASLQAIRFTAKNSD